MSVDVEALKLLAQEKKLPLERLINAIENEVAKAYAELPVALINRSSGNFFSWAKSLSASTSTLTCPPA